MLSSIKTESEVLALKKSGHITAKVLDLMRRECHAGMTPKEMSAMANKELERLGGQPAFLGFHGYPDIICISVNEQVQHSIPNDRPFKPGDVVNFDFGAKYNGMITDAGISVCIDDHSNTDTSRLLKGTEQALQAGLSAVRAGCHVGDISAAIERVLRKHRLGIVRELVGHGVGHELHEDPEIPNFGQAGRGPILKAGMTVAIEPIATLGSAAIYEEKDGWTLRTVDGSWAAQFEHTVLVTAKGCEILTKLAD